jgi:hypothetical protein
VQADGHLRENFAQMPRILLKCTFLGGNRLVDEPTDVSPVLFEYCGSACNQVRNSKIGASRRSHWDLNAAKGYTSCYSFPAEFRKIAMFDSCGGFSLREISSPEGVFSRFGLNIGAMPW